MRWRFPVRTALSFSLGIFSAISAYATTFSEFVESLPRLPNDNYVYEHDISTSDIDVLYEYYEKTTLKKLDQSADQSTVIGYSMVNRFSLVKTDGNGNDAIWTGSQKDELTYCIQRDGANGFQDNHSRVANAMRVATADWEAAANVNFRHDTSEDNDCMHSDRVLFRVLETWATWQGGGVQAASFFPDSPAQDRILWIAADMPQNPVPPVSFTGLLRHELGHVLGLVHEHARGDQCPEEGWRALTEYDRYSVMHYRVMCDGPNVDYFMTDLDKEGIAQLYPFPAPPPDPPPVNQPPTARLALSGNSYAQQSSLLDGSASNDVDGHIVRHYWTFGDGESAKTIAPVVEHIYDEVGTYTASLQVEDNQGASSAVSTLTVNVQFNPALFPAIYGTLVP